MINKKKLEIGVYYFPGYGSDHNEWDLVMNAKPYFSMQNQPQIPLGGCYNDNSTSTIRKQISLATKYGIDAFIFDWYWKKGKVYQDKPLKLFIQQKTKMKFALMFSWKLSKFNLPVTPKKEHPSENDRWIKMNKKDFIKILDYCQKNYFSKSNYWKIGSRPYFIIYYIGGFKDKLGPKKFKEMIHLAKEHFIEKGLPVPFFTGVVNDVNKVDLELDALTGYNFLPDFKSNADIIQDYKKLSLQRQLDWQKILDNSKKPYIPTVSLGWDATPRGVRVNKIETKLSFPWVPIVVNNTPNNFKSFLSNAINFAKNKSPNIVNICAWNEWSEGAHLEPDTLNGYSYLNKIKELKKKK